MAEPDDGYDPTEFVRTPVKPFAAPPAPGQDGPEEMGIGLRPEKHATATLRLLTSNMGSQWLMYGGILGGNQDFQPPDAHTGVADCGWFEFFYRGIIVWNETETIGQWKVRVEGSGLERLAYWIAKQVMPTLRPGSTPPSSEHRITVASITISPLPVVPQNGVKLDHEDE
jgi:hypothetical protein